MSIPHADSLVYPFYRPGVNGKFAQKYQAVFNNNNECGEMTEYVQALCLAGSCPNRTHPLFKHIEKHAFGDRMDIAALLLILSRRLLLRAFAVVADVDILKAPFDEIVRVVRD